MSLPSTSWRTNPLGLGEGALTRSVFFLYFFGMGAYAPYISLYFQEIGLTGAQISDLVTGIPALAIFFVPPLWGLLADAKGLRGRLLTIALAGSGLSFLLYLGGSAPFYLVMVAILFSFFDSPTKPILDSLALSVSEKQQTNYGMIRLWGSLGYMVAARLMGPLYAQSNLSLLFWVFAGLTMLAMVLSTRLPQETMGLVAHKAGGRPVWEAFRSLSQLLKGRNFTLLLIAAFVGRVGAVAYYTFFSIHLESLGASRQLIGTAWALGVLGEVIILFFSGRLIKRMGTKNLFVLALLGSGLRWGLYSLLQAPLWVVAFQWMHGFTFSAFHAGAVNFVNKEVPPQLRTSGQAIYTAVTFGFGGFLGAKFIGGLSDTWGLPVLFGISAFLAMSSGVLFLLLAKEPQESKTPA